jgi:transcriptional regulator with XRE-family HTH domain
MLDNGSRRPYKQPVPANDIEPVYADIGRRIQGRRNKIGMTQETLGSKLKPKVTRASIANIEGGKQRILAHTLLQLAETLDVEIAELFSKDRKQITPAIHVEAELAKKLNLPQQKIKKLTAQLKASKREEDA